MENSKIRLISREDILEFERPFGEPDIKWDEERWDDKYENKEPNTYIINRREREGEVIWYGLNTNWKRNPSGQWSFLTVDESVSPISDGVYPESRFYFKDCEMPIYEELYLVLCKK